MTNTEIKSATADAVRAHFGEMLTRALATKDPAAYFDTGAILAVNETTSAWCWRAAELIRSGEIRTPDVSPLCPYGRSHHAGPCSACTDS